MNFQKIEGLRKGSVNYVYEGYLFIKNKADKETTSTLLSKQTLYQNKQKGKFNPYGLSESENINVGHMRCMHARPHRRKDQLPLRSLRDLRSR